MLCGSISCKNYRPGKTHPHLCGEWHQLLLPDKSQQHFPPGACTQRGIPHLWGCGALAQQGGPGPKHLGRAPRQADQEMLA